MNRLVAAGLIAVGFVVLVLIGRAVQAAPHQAEMAILCDTRAPLVDWLASQHGEVPGMVMAPISGLKSLPLAR